MERMKQAGAEGAVLRQPHQASSSAILAFWKPGCRQMSSRVPAVVLV